MPFTDEQQDQKANESGDNNANQGQGDQPFLTIGDRTFKTQEDLIRHVTSAQQHISTLEQEAKARQEKEQSASHAEENQKLIRELLDGLKQNGKADQTDQSSNVTLNKDELVDAVLNRVNQMQTAEQKKGNSDACEIAAIEAYGEEHYNAKIAAKAKELGMDLKAVNYLAETSPNAFKNLFIPKPAQKGPGSFKSDEQGQSAQALDLNMRQGGNEETFSLNGKNAKQQKDMFANLGDKYELYG